MYPEKRSWKKHTTNWLITSNNNLIITCTRFIKLNLNVGIIYYVIFVVQKAKACFMLV